MCDLHNFPSPSMCVCPQAIVAPTGMHFMVQGAALTGTLGAVAEGATC